MKIKIWIASLLLSWLTVPSLAKADDFFDQLRREDGTTEAAQTEKKPLQPLTVQSKSWTQPVWLQARGNPPGFSARGSAAAQNATYGSGAGAPTDLSVKVMAGWDSEFIFRGLQLAKQSVSGGIEAAYGNAYAGAYAVVPTADSFNFYQNRFELFAGYGFDLREGLYGDVGVTGYIRTDDGVFFAQKDSVEAYAGLTAGGPFNPSLYGYYDFTFDRYTVEASAEYSLPFGRTDLVIGGTAGYTNGNGIDYGYGQVDIELVQNFNRNTSIGIGGHFAASTENTFFEGLALTGDTTTWFGIRLRASK